MPKVLIAEDELIYRDYLAAALDADGYDVTCTTNGRDAIRTGTLFRPDILITDWMLKSNIHGLHVSRVLRQINPELRTILITGFASSDVLTDSSADEVFALIYKPFDMGELKEKVSQASFPSNTTAFHSNLGFLEIDQDNNIIFSNSLAANLLGVDNPEKLNGNINQYINSFQDLNSCRDLQQWCSAETKEGQQELMLFPLKFSDKEGYLLVVIDSAQRLLAKSKLIELIIESYSTSPEIHSWPFEGRILLIDENSNFRRVTVDLFDAAGVLCHSTKSLEQASNVIDRDLGLRYILVNCQLLKQPGLVTECREFSWSVQKKIPEIKIIGFGNEKPSPDLQTLGFSCFLQEPWTIEQLIELIKEQEKV